MAANDLTIVARHPPNPATIIGATPARFTTGGRIRPGIKVLTQAAAGNVRAAQIYEAGLQAGTSYEDRRWRSPPKRPGLTATDFLRDWRR